MKKQSHILTGTFLLSVMCAVPALAQGFDLVINNGQVTVRDDVLLPVFAGQPIQHESEGKPRFVPISVESWNVEFSTGMPSDFTGAFPVDGGN